MQGVSPVLPAEIRRIQPKDLWQFVAALNPDRPVDFGVKVNIFCEYWRARFGNHGFRVNLRHVNWDGGEDTEMPRWTEDYQMRLVNWPNGLPGQGRITVAWATEVLRRRVTLPARSHPQVDGQVADPLFTITEAANYRGVRPDTIRAAIKRGTLNPFPLHLPNDPQNYDGDRIQRSELDRYSASVQKSPELTLVRKDPEKIRRRDIVELGHIHGYLTIPEVAKMMDLSRTRIVAMCKRRRNRLKRVWIDGVWFIPKEDAQRFVALRHNVKQRGCMLDI